MISTPHYTAGCPTGQQAGLKLGAYLRHWPTLRRCAECERAAITEAYGRHLQPTKPAEPAPF